MTQFNKYCQRYYQQFIAVGVIAILVLGSLSLVFPTRWAIAASNTVQVMALMRDKAIVMIDGKRHVLRVGDDSAQGVTLLKADTSSATVLINGREEILQQGMVVTPVVTARDNPVSDDGNGVVLWQENDGFFRAEGTIDGHNVRFLVDTGANIVAINEATAKAAGIDLTQGRVGTATTASGQTRMVVVTIKELKIGSLSAFDVEAGVIYGAYPKEPLLGQSFLSSFTMNRDGDRLEMTRRW